MTGADLSALAVVAAMGAPCLGLELELYDSSDLPRPSCHLRQSTPGGAGHMTTFSKDCG